MSTTCLRLPATSSWLSKRMIRLSYPRPVRQNCSSTTCKVSVNEDSDGVKRRNGQPDRGTSTSAIALVSALSYLFGWLVGSLHSHVKVLFWFAALLWLPELVWVAPLVSEQAIEPFLTTVGSSRNLLEDWGVGDSIILRRICRMWGCRLKRFTSGSGPLKNSVKTLMNFSFI